MKKYWVYVHTCPNGKRYVGITTASRPERRWLKGRGYKGQLFGKAVRKYGWSSIKHEAWELTCESEMYYAEKYLIAYYHTTESEFGYNRSEGGECIHLGCKHSEEARKKISETLKKSHSDPEYRKKISETMKRKWSDSEIQERRSDPEFREKMVEAMKERWSDLEYRRKMSEAQKKVQKKVHADPEYRKKISETMKNRPRIKIKLPDGTILEMTKNNLVKNYIKKEKKFEYVS